jgi:hypothetical protein
MAAVDGGAVAFLAYQPNCSIRNMARNSRLHGQSRQGVSLKPPEDGLREEKP